MTRVAIHQPNYLPWLGFFHKIWASDVFILLDDVAFQQGNSSSITNRARVKGPNGVVLLTVPVRRHGSRVIRDVRVDDSRAWRHKHIVTIRQAYADAPATPEILRLLERTLATGDDTLADLSESLIKDVCAYLGISTRVVRSSGLGVPAADRNVRLADLCRAVGGSEYLSGAGGRKYLDPGVFSERGISVRYTGYAPPDYPQLHGPFVPGLSVIDALCNLGLSAQALVGHTDVSEWS